MTTRSKTLTRAAIIFGFAILFAMPAWTAADDGQEGQRIVFSMNAQHVGTGGGGMTPLTIVVNRWSSMDEADALEETLATQGMQALADALRSAQEVGFIRAPSIGATGWRLRYAQMYRGPEEGTRIIHIATDRPIDFEEAFTRQAGGNWAWDYNVTFIEMTVDDEGNGEGVLGVGVEFRYDEENDTLTMASVSSQPIRLNGITMRIEGGN